MKPLLPPTLKFHLSVTLTVFSGSCPQIRRAEQGQEPIKEHLLLTRYNPGRVSRGDMLSMEDVLEILCIPLIGVIPEDQSVLRSSNQGEPVILDQESDAGKAYDDTVARILGEDRPFRFIEEEKKVS